MAAIKQRNRGLRVSIPIVSTMPDLNDAKEGELFYDIANSRIALRVTTGWVTFAQD